MADIIAKLVNKDGDTIYPIGITPAVNIEDDSITTSKIVDGAVTTAKLADGSVTSAKIADGTIQGADIASSTITSDNINWTTLFKWVYTNGGYVYSGETNVGESLANFTSNGRCFMPMGFKTGTKIIVNGTSYTVSNLNIQGFLMWESAYVFSFIGYCTYAGSPSAVHHKLLHLGKHSTSTSWTPNWDVLA